MGIIRQLRSRRFAVTFIVLISISLVLATVIPQTSSLSEAELFLLRSDHPELTEFIKITGLDHVYTTWWFLGIVLLFSLNIALSLSDRIRITIKQLQDDSPLKPEQIERLHFNHILTLPDGVDVGIKRDVSNVISGLSYRIKEYPDGLSASKGRFGLWSVSIFHGSMLIILMGILISSLTKFSGNIEISEGQMFNGEKEEFIKKGYGVLRLEPDINFSLLLKKFNAEYWDAEHPKLYRSVIDVVENGSTVLSKNVEMNEPLRYKGFSFYQLKYHGYSASLSKRDKSTENEIQGYVNFPYQERYAGIISKEFTIPQTNFRARLRFDVAYPDIMAVTVLSGNTPIWDGVVPKGGGVNLGKSNLIFNGIVKWTGIYVSRDYGVPVVYSGFVLLIIAVFSITFIVPKKLWIVYDNNRIIIGAKIIRDREAFKEEFEGIINKIKGHLP